MKKARKYSLPDDWDIPITTQRWSYRDPAIVNTTAAKPAPISRPTDNLRPDGKGIATLFF